MWLKIHSRTFKKINVSVTQVYHSFLFFLSHSTRELPPNQCIEYIELIAKETVSRLAPTIPSHISVVSVAFIYIKYNSLIRSSKANKSSRK